MKRDNILIICMLSLLLIGCYKTDFGTLNSGSDEGITLDDLDPASSSELDESPYTWDGVTAAENFNGVAFDPNTTTDYEITDGFELAYLAEIVKSGDYDLTGFTFTMTRNINLGNHLWWVIGSTDYVYTYYDDEYTLFKGTFDGNGYSIKRLYRDDVAGLFGSIAKEGVVKNLTIEAVLLNANGNAGSIADSNFGTVENCHTNGTITTTYNYVGGIVGRNCDGGQILNCSNSATVTGTGNNAHNIGGIVGLNTEGNISGCYNTGDISSSESGSVGGIAGKNSSNSTISYCYNIGNVEANTTVGGVCGHNADSQIRSVYNKGDIKAYLEWGLAGGVVGTNQVIGGYGTYIDTRCDVAYNVGNVNADNICGGIVSESYCDITYCYVLADQSFGYYNSGEAAYKIAYYTSVTLEYCEALTQSQMTNDTLLNYLNQGDSGAWAADSNSINEGYPILTAINY